MRVARGWKYFAVLIGLSTMYFIHLLSEVVNTFPRGRFVDVQYGYSKRQNITALSDVSRAPQTTHQPEQTLLTLFTTWKLGMESNMVYSNTLHSWAMLQPFVRLVFFGDEKDLPRVALKLGWIQLPVSNAQCNGTPVLNRMFTDVYERFDSTFYGYANGDILFDRGLIDTLVAVKQSKFFKQNKGILVSGRRIDFYGDSVKDMTVLFRNVSEFSLKGSISYGYAADYFITTKSYPWTKIPEFVVGRPKYDNYLLYMSRQYNVHVIDATMTVVALHQRTKSRRKSRDECNEQILKASNLFRKKHIDKGHLGCAIYESQYLKNGEVVILKRGQFTRPC